MQFSTLTLLAASAFIPAIYAASVCQSFINEQKRKKKKKYIFW